MSSKGSRPDVLGKSDPSGASPVSLSDMWAHQVRLVPHFLFGHKTDRAVLAYVRRRYLSV